MNAVSFRGARRRFNLVRDLLTEIIRSLPVRSGAHRVRVSLNATEGFLWEDLVIDATIIWDLDDDSDGNVQHIAEHDVTADEVEEVLYD
jgi:hypothetical protein